MSRSAGKQNNHSPDHASLEEMPGQGQDIPFQVALVIEPDMLPRLALRQQLLQSGILVVHEAEDGEDGMAWLSRPEVDLVLSRWEPGGVDCLQLLKSLKGKGKTPRIPLVLLDWGLPQVTIVAAVKAGVAARLMMPSTPAKVRQALQEIMEARRLAGAIQKTT